MLNKLTVKFMNFMSLENFCIIIWYVANWHLCFRSETPDAKIVTRIRGAG